MQSELSSEDDWTLFLSSLEADVLDAFMSVVSLLEVSRDLADCFRPVTLGHLRQRPEPVEGEPLLVGRHLGDDRSNTPQRLLSAAA